MLGIFGSYVNTTGLLENTDIIYEICETPTTLKGRG